MKYIYVLFLILIVSLSSCKDEEIITCEDENKNYQFFSNHAGKVWYRSLAVYEYYYRINQDSFDEYSADDQCANYSVADCEYNMPVGGIHLDNKNKYSQTLIEDQPNFISFRIESVSLEDNYSGVMSYSINDTGDTLTWSLEDNLSFDKGMWFVKSNAPFPNIICD